MENKYYTPTTEEFENDPRYYKPSLDEVCIGFECELYYKNYVDRYKVKKCVLKDIDDFYMDREEYGTISDILDDFNNDALIRTKYLTKEDIEELGWIYHAVYDNIFYKETETEFGICYLEYLPNNKIIIDSDRTSDTLFNGIIKNKSELKKLMYQLNIL